MEDLFSTISSFFPDLDFNICDLLDPKPYFIQYFLNRALLEFGVDADNIKKPQMGQPNDLAILPQLNLLKAVKTAFPFLNVGLLDLISPRDAQGSISLIRQVMEYMNFCDENTVALNLKAEPMQKAMEHERIIASNRELLNQKMNQFALEKRNLLQKLEKMNEQITEKQKLLQEAIQKKNTLIEIRDEKKAIAQRSEQKIDALIAKTAAVESEIESMQNEIVERFGESVDSDLIETQLTRRDQAQREKKMLWDKMKEKRKVRDKYKKVLDLILEEHNKLSNLQELMNINSDVEQNLAKSTKEAANLKNELEKLKREKERVESAIVSSSVSKAKAGEDTEREVQRLQEAISERRKEASDKHQEVKGLKKKKNQHEEKLRETEQSVEDIKARVKVNITEFVKAKAIFDNKVRYNIEKTEAIKKHLQKKTSEVPFF